MAEMAEMGIGNKPCLEIRPSQNQISDRSISYAQLAKGKLVFSRWRMIRMTHRLFNPSRSAQVPTFSVRFHHIGQPEQQTTSFHHLRQLVRLIRLVR